MQTDEDKNIQSRLESAGKGLPAVEALSLKYILFPLLKVLVPWNLAMRIFESIGTKILDEVKQLDEPTLFRKVLIPRIFGIEDNSRYYSPAMVLLHLIYVGAAIQEGIISLSKNESLDFVVKIANFKPFAEISPGIVNEYETFLKGYRRTLEADVRDKHARKYHAHPWFGPLNPHQWLVMSAVHQWVHARQLRKIQGSR